MKIEEVWVDDPRIDLGEVQRPILCVRVEPRLFSNTKELEYRPSGVLWTTQKFGPFVKYFCELKDRNTSGNYNVAFRDQFPALVDIKIHNEGYYMEGFWGLPVRRARQLMKQHDVPYRLLMNDYDGQRGLPAWTPVEKWVTCKAWLEDEGKTCGLDASGVTTQQGVDMPYCREHLAEFNQRQKVQRQTTSS